MTRKPHAAPAATANPRTPKRESAVDIFRGATVAFMILVNNPGTWNHLYAPLAHAPWHGCTLTDLVFPFFLFAVGNAMALSWPQRSDPPSAEMLAKVGKRVLWIFGLGLFLNFSPFVRWSASGELVWRSLEHLRIMGVLQRIALSYGIAALLVLYLPRRALAPVTLGLLLLYWAMCLSLGQADDPYSLQGFFGTALDRTLLGPQHLYQGEGLAFDPEGLGSTLPCVSQVLIGYVVGVRLRDTASTSAGVRTLVLWALALILAGWAWSSVMPLNKKIWTSSYVLISSGWAIAMLASLVTLVNLRKTQSVWFRSAEVFGKNALFIFCLSGFLPRVLALARWETGRDANGAAMTTHVLRWLYDPLLAPCCSDPRLSSLLYAVLMVLFYWLIARELDRRGLYIKV